jgi:hypothetical protein
MRGEGDMGVSYIEEGAGSRSLGWFTFIVIPAKAGIQLHARGPKLDPGVRRGDEGRVRWHPKLVTN